MALTIIYDRNFRTDDEKEVEWSVGQEPPNIAPHRVIEIWADGEERAHVEGIMGETGSKKLADVGFYGDIARMVFINL